MIETHPFGNFFPKNATHLILGSFTSKGFAKGTVYDWFYSNGRNQFWYIMSKVYNVDLEDKSAKQLLLEKLGIGMADIIYQCERKYLNSLDNNLINIVFNTELDHMFGENRLKTVFFTSRYVEKLFNKNFKHIIKNFAVTQFITLPSPSPRFATMSKNEKIKVYGKLLPKLDPKFMRS